MANEQASILEECQKRLLAVDEQLTAAKSKVEGIGTNESLQTKITELVAEQEAVVRSQEDKARLLVRHTAELKDNQ